MDAVASDFACDVTLTGSPSPSAEGGAGPLIARSGRAHRRHRPGRRHVIKVTYDDEELAAVRAAADAVGLTPAGYVGETAVAAARNLQGPVPDPVRAALVELIAVRATLTALATRARRGGRDTDANRETVVVLQWLMAAVDRVDDVTTALTKAPGTRAARDS